MALVVRARDTPTATTTWPTLTTCIYDERLCFLDQFQSRSNSVTVGGSWQLGNWPSHRAKHIKAYQSISKHIEACRGMLKARSSMSCNGTTSTHRYLLLHGSSCSIHPFSLPRASSGASDFTFHASIPVNGTLLKTFRFIISCRIHHGQHVA